MAYSPWGHKGSDTTEQLTHNGIHWNTFLNQDGYVIHHFNAYLLLYGFFANDLLLAVYFIYFGGYSSGFYLVNKS